MADTVTTSTWIQSISMVIIEGADYVESTLHVRLLFLKYLVLLNNSSNFVFYPIHNICLQWFYEIVTYASQRCLCSQSMSII